MDIIKWLSNPYILLTVLFILVRVSNYSDKIRNFFKPFFYGVRNRWEYASKFELIIIGCSILMIIMIFISQVPTNETFYTIFYTIFSLMLASTFNTIHTFERNKDSIKNRQNWLKEFIHTYKHNWDNTEDWAKSNINGDSLVLYMSRSNNLWLYQFNTSDWVDYSFLFTFIPNKTKIIKFAYDICRGNIVVSGRENGIKNTEPPTHRVTTKKKDKLFVYNNKEVIIPLGYYTTIKSIGSREYFSCNIRNLRPSEIPMCHNTLMSLLEELGIMKKNILRLLNNKSIQGDEEITLHEIIYNIDYFTSNNKHITNSGFHNNDIIIVDIFGLDELYEHIEGDYYKQSIYKMYNRYKFTDIK